MHLVVQEPPYLVKGALGMCDGYGEITLPWRSQKMLFMLRENAIASLKDRHTK